MEESLLLRVFLPASIHRSHITFYYRLLYLRFGRLGVWCLCHQVKPRLDKLKLESVSSVRGMAHRMKHHYLHKDKDNCHTPHDRRVRIAARMSGGWLRVGPTDTSTVFSFPFSTVQIDHNADFVAAAKFVSAHRCHSSRSPPHCEPTCLSSDSGGTGDFKQDRS